MNIKNNELINQIAKKKTELQKKAQKNICFFLLLKKNKKISFNKITRKICQNK